MASQRDRVIAQLRKRQEEKLLKKESDSLKAKRTYAEEVKKASPQEDILRFGQEQKKFRDLAYKERVLTETDDKGTKDESDDETKVSMQYIPREGNELFKQQVEAYGDSLKLAGLAQKYGTRTPDVRKIDRNKVNINNEFDKDVKRYMEIYKTQKLPPGIDMVSYAKNKATSDLVRKYGKGIIPLLAELKNR
tara:strand:- start:1196 stop:1771 length:576 start_codon:yes stop_codon:yes gene_type:complete